MMDNDFNAMLAKAQTKVFKLEQIVTITPPQLCDLRLFAFFAFKRF